MALRIKPLRRTVQLVTLLVLVAIPLASANPGEWSPSRIVQGQLPTPSVLPVSGDTWSLSAWGFTLVHPLALVDGVVTAKLLYLPLLVGALLPLGLSIVLGRVFCSWLCPVGFGLELGQRLHPLVARLGAVPAPRVRDVRYPLLVAVLALSFVLAVPVLSILDPPHVFGRELMYWFTHRSLSLAGVGSLASIVLFDLLARSRAWCGSLCPSGGGLALIGAGRLLHLGLDASRCTECGACDAVCPYELKLAQVAERRGADWVKCDNCGLCRDVCPEAALAYGLGRGGS